VDQWSQPSASMAASELLAPPVWGGHAIQNREHRGRVVQSVAGPVEPGWSSQAGLLRVQIRCVSHSSKSVQCKSVQRKTGVVQWPVQSSRVGWSSEAGFTPRPQALRALGREVGGARHARDMPMTAASWWQRDGGFDSCRRRRLGARATCCALAVWPEASVSNSVHS
jgi:hypothetical protein